MLSILGQKSTAYCDGHSRRHFLKIGGLAMGGLALPQVLKAQAATGSFSSSKQAHKAVIMIYLSGGPSHQDMYDIKMNAPAEIRGSFRPIPTNVPGIEICEHMPRLARMMDKFTIIRSLYGSPDQHNSDMCMSGYPKGPRGKQDGHPSLGSVISKLQGPLDPAIPPSIGLTIKTKHLPYSNPGSPGFLGMAHTPFLPDGPEMTEMRLHGVTLDRLRDRRTLLAGYDDFRRRTERQTASQGLDAFTQAAFEVLTSSKLAEALDLDREDPRLRDRYGRGSADPAFGEDAGPHWMDQFLLARRLVEAGARCVSLSFGSWDRHGGNFTKLPTQLDRFDQGITALVEDLHARGLDQDVSVIAWGEFGAPHASTNPPAETTGQGRRALSWPAAACAWARSSVRPTAWAKNPKIDRCTIKTFSLRSITSSASTSRIRSSTTPPTAPTSFSTAENRSAS